MKQFVPQRPSEATAEYRDYLTAKVCAGIFRCSGERWSAPFAPKPDDRGRFGQFQEKHQALRALKYGDPEPWKRYNQERECRFWDSEDRPMVEKIVVNTKLRKNREGLIKHPDFFARYLSLDRQQGNLRAGELPHWWLVIRDALKNADSRLVFEGKVLSDEEVIDILEKHDCVRRCGVADFRLD